MACPLTSVSPSSLPLSLSSAREGVEERAGARDRELRGEGRKGWRARAHARAREWENGGARGGRMVDGRGELARELRGRAPCSRRFPTQVSVAGPRRWFPPCCNDGGKKLLGEQTRAS
jgi:hypothetical protein